MHFYIKFLSIIQSNPITLQTVLLTIVLTFNIESVRPISGDGVDVGRDDLDLAVAALGAVLAARVHLVAVGVHLHRVAH